MWLPHRLLPLSGEPSLVGECAVSDAYVVGFEEAALAIVPLVDFLDAPVYVCGGLGGFLGDPVHGCKQLHPVGGFKPFDE